MTRHSLLLVSFLVACGGGGGGGGDPDGNNNGGGDGPGGGQMDAPSNVPAMITISGTTSSIGISGRTPQGGVTVTAFRASDDSMVAMATSSNDAATKGQFTLMMATNGVPLDGYVTASMGATYLPTYLYPPAPLVADYAGVTVLLLTQSTFDTAQTLVQVNQTPGMAFVGAEIVDAAAATVAGAVLTSTPAGTVKYNGANGLPSKTAAATATDGVAYVFNVAAGAVSVGATKTGSTFTTHSIKARADAITLTIVAP